MGGGHAHHVRAPPALPVSPLPSAPSSLRVMFSSNLLIRLQLRKQANTPRGRLPWKQHREKPSPRIPPRPHAHLGRGRERLLMLLLSWPQHSGWQHSQQAAAWRDPDVSSGGQTSPIAPGDKQTLILTVSQQQTSHRLPEAVLLCPRDLLTPTVEWPLGATLTHSHSHTHTYSVSDHSAPLQQLPVNQ